MCESNVYLKDGEREVMTMESVDTIEPCENGLNLMDMTLLNHRIILEKLT